MTNEGKKQSVCKVCGKTFDYYPSMQNGKFCSQQCYKKSRGMKLIVTCEKCGKQFERRASTIKDHIFCSNACRASMWNNKVEIICKVCGKKFSWRASRLKYYNTECCSKKCSGLSRRNRMKKLCKNCGKEFDIKESSTLRDSPRGSYCSFECYHAFSKGKNSHLYDHGQSFYPYCERFSENLKERVRKFFGDKCVICGKTKDENLNKRLDVHHVFVEKLACCETKIEDMNLVRNRFPNNIAQFGNPTFSEKELQCIRMMVPMCIADHSMVHKLEPGDMKYKDTIYRKMFAEMILNKYDGKSYYTEEEFKEIQKNLGR